ncbi:DUF3237 domain-containing protein [Robertmurraya sp.]|uniref:DUF3237 domain-containing protein n=1 Tax=Robertmurraya sp. TaxID=2837525 RepID=UPI0037040F40
MNVELAMELVVHCGPDLEIGETHGGIRRVVPITGGTFEGPKVKGVVLPGGADWNLTRPDGTGSVWARYTIQADDGTLISIINQGKSYIRSAEELNEQKSEFDFERDVYMYTTPSFEVAGEKYQWLSKNMFIGTLRPHPEGVQLRFYQLI